MAAIAGTLTLFLPAVAREAAAQVAENSPSRSINLGGRGWSAWEGTQTPPPGGGVSAQSLEVSAQAGFASDYIYRGTTLSDRKPAVGAAIEAAWGWAYGGVSMASVKLPTQPAVEITTRGGVRQTIGDVGIDLGMTYFYYPGEVPSDVTNGIDYWEAAIRADRRISEAFRAAAGYAYSPNVSRTGAWSQYAAAGLGYDVPQRLLPQNFEVSITGGAGYSWFGNQTEALGGFPLPAYVNWQAGVTFTHKIFNLDFRYYDTNLSKENCYLFTGDPNALPGGSVDPVKNPDGLTSRWCNATVVAKFWFALN